MKRFALALTLTILGTLPTIAVTLDFSIGNDYGFTQDSIAGTGAWNFVNNQWELTGANDANIALVSPVFTATGGAVTLQFTHARNFESSFDGGVVELSLNGGAFGKVLDGAFTQNGYNDTPLAGVFADESVFSGNIGSQVSIAGLGTFVGGDSYRLRFRAGYDASVLASQPNWTIKSISLDNTADIASIPEPSTFTFGLVGLTAFGFAFRRKLV